MSDPWKADEPIKEENIINESERDSANPENDEYKLVKLEDNGRLSPNFIPGTPLAVYDLETSGTWEKPSFGTVALLYIWGAGGGGAAYYRDNFGVARAHGGAGGAVASILIPLPLIPESVTYAIGQGGDGGVSDVAFEGDDGDDGTPTSFGDFLEAAGGNGGKTDPDNNTVQSGNSTNDSTFGFSLNQLLTGGSSGVVNTGSGQTAQNAADQPYQGAGAGGAQYSTFTGAFSSGNGGLSAFLDKKGGNGQAVNGTATGENGEIACGGGAAVSVTSGASATATGGKGGDGFIRIYIV